MRIQPAAFLALAFVAAFPVSAQSTEHAAHHNIAQAGATAAQSAPMSQGEVRKVDKAAAKITLKHGEIANLEMGAMTMVFQVKDKSMLDKVKAGDKVRFSADKIGGQLTVTAIEPDR